MGILLNVGSRDETQQTSGSCLAIKNTYLKTLKHTNETINYGMIQMSGGEAEMEYDEETIWYNTFSQEYDATDMFRMIADCAFEPRSFLASNVILFYLNLNRLQETKIRNFISSNTIYPITTHLHTTPNYY